MLLMPGQVHKRRQLGPKQFRTLSVKNYKPPVNSSSSGCLSSFSYISKYSTGFNLCCCLVVKSCPTLHDPMGKSTLGPPVFHCPPEFRQIYFGRFGDTVHPSCPLLSPSALAQHQSLFQEVFSSHEMAKGLETQLQDLSFQ